MKAVVDKDLCIGCGTCEAVCGCFKIEDGVANFVAEDCQCGDEQINDAANGCPVAAIKVEE